MSDLREVNINSQGFPITDEGAREILKQKVSKTINNKEITITEEVSLYVGGYSTVNISASSATAFKYKLDDGLYVEVTTPTKITINNATTLFLDSASYPITLTCDLISNTEGLPSHSSADSGKFLRVNAQGNAEWQTVPSAESEVY